MLFPREDEGNDQDAVQKAVILKVDMINDQKSRREEDRQGCCVSKLLVRWGRRLDKARGRRQPWLPVCRSKIVVQVQRIHQHTFCNNDCCPLEIHRLPAIISKISYIEHPRICVPRRLREEPFKVGENRGVVESPF